MREKIWIKYKEHLGINNKKNMGIHLSERRGKGTTKEFSSTFNCHNLDDSLVWAVCLVPSCHIYSGGLHMNICVIVIFSRYAPLKDYFASFYCR